MSNMTIVLSIFFIPALLFLLLPVAALAALQLWLCRQKVRWLGLILPVLAFVISLVICLNFGVYAAATEVGSSAILENGTVVEGPSELQVHVQNLTPEAVVSVVALFLIFNIPTAIFLGIFFYHKNRREFREELQKMTIQDLE